MYNAQKTANKIKTRAKQQKLLIGKMLEECDINKNALSSMLSRGSWLQANNLARIADYLDCSVDYLLGRTDIAERHLTSAEAIVTANNKENVLLLNFRNMNTAGQDYILQTIDMAKDKYKKCDSISDGESIG